MKFPSRETVPHKIFIDNVHIHDVSDSLQVTIHSHSTFPRYFPADTRVKKEQHKLFINVLHRILNFNFLFLFVLIFLLCLCELHT